MAPPKAMITVAAKGHATVQTSSSMLNSCAMLTPTQRTSQPQSDSLDSSSQEPARLLDSEDAGKDDAETKDMLEHIAHLQTLDTIDADDKDVLTYMAAFFAGRTHEFDPELVDRSCADTPEHAAKEKLVRENIDYLLNLKRTTAEEREVWVSFAASMDRCDKVADGKRQTSHDARGGSCADRK